MKQQQQQNLRQEKLHFLPPTGCCEIRLAVVFKVRDGRTDFGAALLPYMSVEQ